MPAAHPQSRPKAATARREQTARLLALHGFTVAAIAAWWAYSQFVPPYLLPGPMLVLRRMAAFVSDAQLALQLAISFGHVASAIMLSFAIGATLAFAAHYLWPARKLVDARIIPFLNAFSGIGWLFLAILWFGIDSTTVIFAVTMILIPFAAINLRTGLIELDTELIELGAACRAHPGAACASCWCRCWCPTSSPRCARASASHGR